MIKLDAEGTMGTPTGFILDSPPRYVVDLPGAWSYAGDRTVALNKGTARSLRFGVHADKLRVVLDLKRQPSKATVRRSASGLTITIR